MADKTSIEWADASWNPIAGCDIESPGCRECYAMRSVAPRLAANPATPHYHGTVKKTKTGYVWTGKIGIASDKVLTKPLRWKNPRKIFVNSTSDLCHPGVSDDVVDNVFAVMALCPQHEFQVLTKRPERMRNYLLSLINADANDTKLTAKSRLEKAAENIGKSLGWDHDVMRSKAYEAIYDGTLNNVLIGTSVEDQKRADGRREPMKSISDLGWKTFVSYEPAIGPVNWQGWDFLDWLICGGESGPRARPMHPAWARTARDYCLDHNIPFLFKQWGEWLPGEFGQIPDLNFQDGTGMDINALPDFDDPKIKKKWNDGLSLVADGLEHCIFRRVGKARAGRLLDGVEHNGFPTT